MQSKIRIGHSDYYIVRNDSKVKVIRASATGETEVIIYDIETGLEKGVAYMYISDIQDYSSFIAWFYKEITGLENASIQMDIIKEFKMKNKRLTDAIMLDIINKMNGARLKC